MCAKHSDQQDDETKDEDLHEAVSTDESDGDAIGDGNLSIEERPRSSSPVATPEMPSTAGLCRVSGCTSLVVKKGLCRFHSIKPRCTSLSGCRSIAHSRGLCLAHYNAQRLHGNAATCSQPTANSQVPQRHASTIQSTAQQQELQARYYCDAALAAKSTELFSILSNGTAAGVAPALPTVRTTARLQQRTAEQHCNEVLAARAFHFIRTNPASRPSAPAVVRPRTRGQRLQECTIRGCLNVANGSLICAAHEAWATGRYPQASASVHLSTVTGTPK
ncbi:unnamed protein product [Phytophthora fragariaefolia]|uniref:Unnamed protein product n=1 Tax=Phytophthora fragariaefolia TaxID=1490495 RepID=A0A9W6U4N1_9STRA|nr:unnamed protein product [Phytophthora fragariaefolia]